MINQSSEALESERDLLIISRPRLEEYSRTLAVQLQLLNAKIKDPSLPDLLVTVEHEPVYTVGRGQLLERANDNGIPWFEISRGGKTTYHGPGQLVCYPIFDLNVHGRDVHVFLRNLEQVAIDTLASFGISGMRREGFTGVWVPLRDGIKKVAAIGVGVRKWISYHGIALNIDPDLNNFQEISPCGQDGRDVTSLAQILAERDCAVPSFEQTQEAVIASFRKVFGLKLAGQQQAQRIDERIDGRVRPSWLKVKAPGSPVFQETNDIVRKLQLVTVCEEAKCPNMGECWSHRTATMMIMGELCTRRCGFCSVRDGTLENLGALDIFEPVRVAQAVRELGLKHIVVTSVNRDDLADMGAAHFNQTVRAIKHQNPDCSVELLIPDMRGDRALVEMILEGDLVSVLNHNVETVPRIYRRVRPGASFKRSLQILRWAKEYQPSVRTKSGLMVGLGEERSEVLEVMDLLREHGVEILTIGQYLQPTPKQLPIDRYITPEEFEDYRQEGIKRGFSFVESAPFVRSSYHAWKHTQDRPSVHTEPVAEFTHTSAT